MDSHKQGGAKVVDAARFSPAQIKEMLDIMQFDQEKEDIYRGIDGRNVADKQLWDPRSFSAKATDGGREAGDVVKDCTIQAGRNAS
jgi:hypothetical protein